MNNKEAIRILGLECDEWDVSHCTASERREAFEMAITALNQLDNNSTKPDDSTATQFNGIENKVKGLTACRVPGDDCISRADVEQTVEDNILCYTHSDRPIDQDPDTECHMAIRTALRMLRKDLRKLPSAQPEIIRCKDCKNWTRTYGDDRWSVGDCDVFDKHLVMSEGYCAWAERRTDEPDKQTD